MQVPIATGSGKKDRRVCLFDDSTVSMPDTQGNQEDYRQHDSQKQGPGFPLARITAIFLLSCGAMSYMAAHSKTHCPRI